MHTNGLSAEEIARKLTIGLPAIDRMKREVERMIRTILVLIEPDIIKWLTDRQETYGSHEFQWSIRKNIWGYLEIRGFRVNSTDKDRCFFLSTNPNRDDAVNFSLHRVQEVHEALPLFVQWMTMEFPLLVERLQPFLDAADYAEKNGW